MAPTSTNTQPPFGQVEHDVSHAWYMFSAFIARGGTEFLPELDDPRDVCERLERMPEGMLDRLDPSFAALERENDPQGRYRAWYKKLCENYTAAMIAARLIAGPDQEERYQECARVVKETASSFEEYFDALREFIDCTHKHTGRWRDGDSFRDKWDMKVFDRQVVWG